MIGELVAIRIEDFGSSCEVTGLVAQPKNRRAAWSFVVTRGTLQEIHPKVQECEEQRKAATKE